MSVSAPRARVEHAERGTRCPHCLQPVIEAMLRRGRGGGPIRIDPTPIASGTLQLVDGMAQFIPPEYRDQRSRWYVPEGERYRSHRLSCPAMERTLSAESAEYIERVDRRLADAS